MNHQTREIKALTVQLRKWVVYIIQLKKYGWHGKFDKETNYRGEYPHGHLWESEQAAKDNRQADKMFKALFHKFRNINPTLEQMIKVYEVLGLDKEDI